MAFKSTSIDAWTGGYRPLIFDIHETLPDIYIYITIKENPSGNRIGWRLTSKVEWLRLVVAGRLRHQFQNVSLVHWPVRRVLHLVVIKQRHRSVNHRCSINSCYLSWILPWFTFRLARLIGSTGGNSRGFVISWLWDRVTAIESLLCGQLRHIFSIFSCYSKREAGRNAKFKSPTHLKPKRGSRGQKWRSRGQHHLAGAVGTRSSERHLWGAGVTTGGQIISGAICLASK